MPRMTPAFAGCAESQPEYAKAPAGTIRTVLDGPLWGSGPQGRRFDSLQAHHILNTKPGFRRLRTCPAVSWDHNGISISKVRVAKPDLPANGGRRVRSRSAR